MTERKVAADALKAEQKQTYTSALENRAAELEAYSVVELRHLAAIAITNGELGYESATSTYAKASALLGLAMLKQMTEGPVQLPVAGEVPRLD